MLERELDAGVELGAILERATELGATLERGAELGATLLATPPQAAPLTVGRSAEPPFFVP